MLADDFSSSGPILDLEYVPGKTLRWRAEASTFSPSEVLMILDQGLAVLTYLHELDPPISWFSVAPPTISTSNSPTLATPRKATICGRGAGPSSISLRDRGQRGCSAAGQEGTVHVRRRHLVSRRHSVPIWLRSPFSSPGRNASLVSGHHRQAAHGRRVCAGGLLSLRDADHRRGITQHRADLPWRRAEA